MVAEDSNQNEQMQSSTTKITVPISRRGFLAATGITASGMVIVTALNKPKRHYKASADDTKYRWGMLIDLNKCIGCQYCTYACQAVNNLSDDMVYNVVTINTTQTGVKYYLPRPCMHCDEPPCVHVCPVNATYLRPDGIVTMDYERCIGCRYCQVACPYDARVFNWREHTGISPRVPAFGQPEVPPRPRGVMEKCTFCEHRIDSGLARNLMPGVDVSATPACVVACPTGARVFGDLNNENSPISLALKEVSIYIRLREELDTEPKVLYIPPRETT